MLTPRWRNADVIVEPDVALPFGLAQVTGQWNTDFTRRTIDELPELKVGIPSPLQSTPESARWSRPERTQHPWPIRKQKLARTLSRKIGRS